jgi:hypothetical protein
MLYLHASEVAAAIGASRFKRPDEVMQAVRDRTTGRASAETRRMAELPVQAVLRGAAAIDRPELVRRSELVTHEGAAVEAARETAIAACIKREREAATPKEAVVARAATQRVTACHDRAAEAVVVKRAKVVVAALESAVEMVVAPDVPRAVVDTHEAAVIGTMQAAAPEVVRAAVRKAVQHTVRVARGVRAEPAIVDAHERSTGSNVTERNEEINYLVVGPVRVGGRCDGIDRAGGTLVEAKHRRSRFLGVPDYEAIQCEIYMRMYNLQQCTLVEHYEGASRAHPLEQSADRWGRIERGLRSFSIAYQKWTPTEEASPDDLFAFMQKKR